MSYASEVLADSPIARFRLNDDAPVGAGSIVDSIGSYSATPNGTIAWRQAGCLADGTSNSARLDGTTGFIAGSAALANAFLGSAWTVELWFFASVQNGGDIFSAFKDGSNAVRIEHFDRTLYSTSIVGGVTVTKSSTVAGVLYEQWNHLVRTSTGKLFVNGVEQVGAGGSNNNATNRLVIGARQDGGGKFNGRISEVSLYATALSDARIAAHFAAGIAGNPAPGRTFYHTFEQDTPDEFPPGSDDLGRFDQGSSRSTAQAYSGAYSLSLGGATFRSLTFDNPHPRHVWASTQEGMVKVRFRFTGTLPGTVMLFQLTGKDRNGINDTNQGVALRMLGGNWSAQYSYTGGTATVSTPHVAAADVWHEAIIRWRATTTPNLAVSIDGVEVTGNSPNVGVVACTAWHHLLIGNDVAFSPTGLWLDEFEVFGSWDGDAVAGDTTAPTVTAASINSAGDTLTVTFSEEVTGGSGFTVPGYTLGTASGSGTSRTYSITPTVYSTATLTLNYAPGDVADTATVPNALAAFTDLAVTNGSAAVEPVTTEITVDSVTFTLAGEPTVGQYANGDYWVLGPVEITAISPPSATVDGWTKNGAQVNPVAGVSTQGFDSSIAVAAQGGVYDESLNIDPGNTGSPLVLATGTVCKSVSKITPQAPGGSVRPQLADMVYLTVVESVPEAGAFRPAPVGTDKVSYWNESDLDYSFLKSIAPLTGAPSLGSAEASMQRPWVEFCANPVARWIHPENNQPEYGRDVSTTIAACAWHLNFNHTNEQKRTLFVRMVQYGLDIYGSVSAGMTYPSNGSINPGRKLPLLIAGRALNDSSILAWGDGEARFVFHDDRQTWLVTGADVGRPVTMGEPGFPREPYTEAHVGLYEWGAKHDTQPMLDGSNWDAAYRNINIRALIGHALLAHLMGLRETWNWKPFFGYYRRAWGIEKSNPHGGLSQIQTVDHSGWTLFEADFDAVSAPPSATGYTLTGPTTGRIGSARTFTISAVPEGAQFDGTATFAQVNTGLTGSFSAPTVTPAAGSSSVTFTFTGSAESSGTIGVTDNKGWTDPAAIAFTVAEASTTPENLSLFNQLSVAVGATGGHQYNLDALNAISQQLTGSAGHTRNLAALNAIAGHYIGSPQAFTLNIDALNAITGKLGGASNNTRTVDALAGWLGKL